MKRREFTVGALAAGLFTATAFPVSGQSGGTYKKAKMRLTETEGDHKQYNLKKIPDPTGTASSRQIERFELRGGDCSGAGDCTARIKRGEMNSRTRIEKVFATDLKLGEQGLFRYGIYFPSDEYNHFDVVGSTFGQVLCAYKRGSEYNSFNIVSLDKVAQRNNYILEANCSERRFGEEDRVKTRNFRVGSMRDYGFMDRWLDVQFRFRLSDKNDGFIEPVVDGRRLGRFEGATQLPDGFLEVRYGIYQSYTNLYPGGPSKMPPQVVYFANPAVYRLV